MPTLRALAVALAFAPSLVRADAPAPAPPPAPYSLPFQLRPALAPNVVRLDSSVAAHDVGARTATTWVNILNVGYRLAPGWGVLVRAPLTTDRQPGGTSSAFGNPALIAIWAPALPHDLKLAASFAVALPLGQGGGDAPVTGLKTAQANAVLTRAAMDNALFAVNDLVLAPGADLAWVRDGFTVQIEATVLQLLRVRGEAAQPDSARTNLTAGLHVGWFAAPWVSFAAELRHQRWLSTPAAVEANAAKRDTSTAALGLRLHMPFGGTVFRPGIAWMTGLDAPLTAENYRMAQVDLAVTF